MKKTEQAPKRYSEDEVDEIVRKAIRQDREFLAQVLRGMPNIDAASKQDWIEEPSAVSDVLSQGFSPTRPTERKGPSHIIIGVNRSIHPAYPDMLKRANDKLEGTGPAEYDLITQVSLWNPRNEMEDISTHQSIYNHLKKHDMLESCLGFQDALEIQKRGITVFRRVFGNNTVIFWRSIALSRFDNSLYVSSLYVRRGRVEISWEWLGQRWDNSPAARFKEL